MRTLSSFASAVLVLHPIVTHPLRIDMKGITRRNFLNTVAAVSATGTSYSAIIAGREPIILATDIGDDIDDTWALMMLLRMPELDVKLVVSDYGNAIYRCRLLGKLLQLTGRTDIPIGLGLDKKDKIGQQSNWISDYQITDYPGIIHANGVSAIIETIMRSPKPVTLLSIGPAPTIARAIELEPAITENARFVGMHGSVYKGYNGEDKPVAEWNVRAAPKALQTVFAAPWDITLTPLDTCGIIKLDGERYQHIYKSQDPWLKALIENYIVWLPGAPYIDPATDTASYSTTLFDTVAVYLAAEEDLCHMQKLPLRVTDNGYTVIDKENGRPVNCAIAWRNLEAFKSRLVEILLS
ncbi:MAG: nucleoside hydrolase [Woeseia sp.]|nr:nucleoside hydrolase [Woeseia sp.]